MYFCKNCDNMYYMRISSTFENRLIYYCRSCGTEDDQISMKGICVINTQNNSQEKLNHMVNRFLKNDPRNPHISNIPCPNNECICNTSDKAPDVIYIRYDNAALSHLYICNYCDETWVHKK